MSGAVNRRVVLARHPRGAVVAADLAVAAGAVPAIGDGEMLIRNLWLSLDPMIRLFIAAEPMGAIPVMAPGTTIPGAAVGEVIESRNADFAAGDIVEGRLGWQEYAVSAGAGLSRIDPADGPVERALGVFGLPGFSAYVGLDVAGSVRAGQTMLVSGAAGAVGSAAGALAAARGARVVGIASGAAKRAWLIDEIGYHAVVDRSAAGFEAALAAALPGGADVYFDNVGGPMMMQAVPHLNRNGIVVICGLMAQYGGEGAASDDQLPGFLELIMGKSLSVRAFVNLAHQHLRPAFLAEMKALVAARPALATIHVTEGIEQTPAAFEQLFAHGVTGKRLVRV
ncbi:MDR family NADP-dependent oxidoreductase [Sphingomonas immobilis]|uniref:NADP-dependent oxidoreductase n=1 Tax=Sphingomonas immobilis TaxID=3063997 RepID=A0ABT8ZYE8_9SPHN|nr:NADP-dependent oxidoreductase [Sphingomonas sp. CA1-15]MDO7842134.1 NADP-dependent oxidoreductase [Sphingomonas sp. CA1-15]